MSWKRVRSCDGACLARSMFVTVTVRGNFGGDS